MTGEIGELIATSNLYDGRKHDTVAKISAINWAGRNLSYNLTDWIGASFSVDQAWADSVGVTPIELTLHAFRQTCIKLGTAVWPRRNKPLPVDYLLTLPDDVVEKNLNYATATYADKFPNRSWMFREYTTENQEGVVTEGIRAVLDGQYPAISNTELLQVTEKMTAGNPYTLVRPHLSPDELNVRIAVKDVSDNYAVGVYVGNSEIGTSKIRILPFVQRHTCTNSIVSVDGGIELVHRGNIHALRVQLTAALAQALHASGEILERMMAAEQELIPNFADVLRGMSSQYNWSEAVTASAFLGTEGRETRAGLVNGVTFTAHKHFTGTAQAEMEMLGGAILAAPNSLFATAARQAGRVSARVVEEYATEQ